MAGLTAYPASAAEQTIRPEFNLDDGQESKRGYLKSLRLMHYMKKLEDTTPTTEADSKGGQGTAAKAPAASSRVEEGETVFDTMVQLTADLRIKKTFNDSVVTATRDGEKPPEVVPGKMHLPPHWRHAGPSAAQQAVLDAATAEALKSIHGDAAKKPNAVSKGDVPMNSS